MRCDRDKSKPLNSLAFAQLPPRPTPPSLESLIPASYPKPPALVYAPSQAGLLPPILPCFPHSFQDLCPQHPTGLVLQVTWDITFPQSPPLCLCRTGGHSCFLKCSSFCLSHAPGISSGPLTTHSLSDSCASASLCP